MHFFNPAPVMRLVEVIARRASTPTRRWRACAALGEAMGKRVIDAADGPGLPRQPLQPAVRPRGAALPAGRPGRRRDDRPHRPPRRRLPDGAVRAAGPRRHRRRLRGRRSSFHELSFGEPRWRPSPLQARMAARGPPRAQDRRAAGTPTATAPHRPDDPPPPEVGGGDGLIVVAGDSRARRRAARGSPPRPAGRSPAPDEAAGEVPFLALDCGRDDDDAAARGRAAGAAVRRARRWPRSRATGPAVGFHALPPLAASRLVELTREPVDLAVAAARAERFFATLGKHVAWVGDAPGLVLGRIVCQLVNEAAFALGEGVGSAEDIDAGMVLGLNHPRGPLAWADAIGARPRRRRARRRCSARPARSATASRPLLRRADRARPHVPRGRALD